MFVNATLDEIAHEAEQIPYSHLQLHGDEGPSFCSEAARRTGCKIIKAARVAGPGDIRDLERFHTDFHLLDAAAAGLRGGSGQSPASRTRRRSAASLRSPRDEAKPARRQPVARPLAETVSRRARQRWGRGP